MSGWISQSLSNIGGKLTEFTKEVLTELPQEEINPADELQVTKKQIVDSEAQIQSLFGQISRLEEENVELSERAAAAELRLKLATEEHRNAALQSLTEIKELRQQIEVFQQREPERRDDSLPSFRSHHGGGGHEDIRLSFSADGTDSYIGPASPTGSSDSVLDYENRQLRDQIKHLSAEVAHWKEVVKAHQSKDVYATKPSSSRELDPLESQIASLKRQLAEAVERHQSEVASLQEHQAEKLEMMRRTYETQLKQVQKPPETSEEKGAAAGDDWDMWDSDHSTESGHSSLRSGVTTASMYTAVETLIGGRSGRHRHAEELETLHKEKDALQQQLVDLQQTFEDKADSGHNELKKSVKALEEENAALRSSLEDLDKEHQLTLAHLLQAKDQASSRHQLQSSEIEELKTERQQARDQLNLMHVSLEGANEKIKNLIENKEKLQNEAQELTFKNIQLLKEQDELVAKVVSLESSNKELGETLLSLRTECAQLGSEHLDRDQELYGELDRLKEDLAEYEQKYEQCRNENQTTAEELLRLTVEFNHLNEQLMSAKANTGSEDTLKSELQRLTSELGVSLVKREELILELEGFQMAKHEADEKLERLQCENAELREAVSQVKINQESDSISLEKNLRLDSEAETSEQDHVVSDSRKSSTELIVHDQQTKATVELLDKYRRHVGPEIVQLLEGLAFEDVSDAFVSVATPKRQKSHKPLVSEAACPSYVRDCSNSSGKDSSDSAGDWRVETTGGNNSDSNGNDGSWHSSDWELAEGAETEGNTTLKVDCDKNDSVCHTESSISPVHPAGSEDGSAPMADEKMELTELKAKLKCLEDMHNELETRAQSQHMELSEAFAALHEKTEECERLRLEVSEQQTTLSDKDDMIRQAYSELKALEMNLEEYRTKDEQSRCQINELSTKNVELETAQNDLQSLRQQHGRIFDEHQQLMALVAQKHEEVLKYHEEVQRLSVALSASCSEVQQLQSTLVLQQSVRCIDGTVQTDVEKTEIEIAHRDVETRTATIEALSNKIVLLNVELDNVKQELTVKAETEQNLVFKLQEIDNERLSLISQLTALSNKLAGAEEKNTASVDDLKLLQNNLAAMTAMKSRAVSELELERQRIQGLVSQVKTFELSESKAQKEMERLRSHLMQVEENYTRDMQQAEDRETELRTELRKVQEQFHAVTEEAQTQDGRIKDQVCDLRAQLEAIAAQRDSVVLQLSEKQDELDKQTRALTNLQQVLQHFQQDHDSQAFAEIEKYKEEVSALVLEKADFSDKVAKLKIERESERNQLLAKVKILQEELDSFADFKEEAVSKEHKLSQLQAEFSEIRRADENKIDKCLLKNLFLGYFSAPGAKKSEVAHLIGSVLGFSLEEFKRISGNNSTGWLNFLQLSSSAKTSVSEKSQAESLTAEFIKFLESESAPKPVPLPLLPPADINSPYVAFDHSRIRGREAYTDQGAAASSLQSLIRTTPVPAVSRPFRTTPSPVIMKSEESSLRTNLPSQENLPNMESSSSADLLRQVLKNS